MIAYTADAEAYIKLILCKDERDLYQYDEVKNAYIAGIKVSIEATLEQRKQENLQ